MQKIKDEGKYFRKCMNVYRYSVIAKTAEISKAAVQQELAKKEMYIY